MSMQYPTDWSGSKLITIDTGMVDGSSNITGYELILNETILSTAQKTEIFGNSQGKQIADNYLLNDSALEAYYKLESGVTDESSNSYDLTASGSPTYTTGKFGNGIDLEESSSQFAYIANASCANLNFSGSFTVSAWVKMESFASARRIVAKFDGTTGYSLYTDASQKIAFGVTGMTTTNSISSGMTIDTGRWYHVVGVFDVDMETIKVYLNGQKFETVTGGGTRTNSSEDFHIGAYSAVSGVGATGFFDGIIDDVGLWSRALSDHEVYSLFTGGADVRFSISSGGTEYIIPHAMIDWDIDNETFSSVVKLPTLYDASDTELYMRYGNSTATAEGRELNTVVSLYNDASLEAHWRFESDLTDETGTNDATAINAPSYATAKFGNGLDLESGSSQAAYIADNASLSITGDLSISAWIKMESLSSDMTIIAKDDVSGDRCWSFIVLSTGELRLATFGSGSTSTRWDSKSTDGNAVEGQVGKWVHVAVVFDASVPDIKMYVNGKEVPDYTKTISTGTDITDGSNRVLIGARDNSGTPEQFFDGVIDDLCVFSRILLPIELQAIYGETGAAFRSACRGFWGFNGNGRDLSVYGNDFTDWNGHTWVTGAFGEAADWERDSSQYWSVPSASMNDMIPSTSTDRTLTLYAKNESVEYSKNENMFGWLNTGNSVGYHWRVAQNVRTYGITDPASSTFFITNGNNTNRMAADFAFDRTGTWVYQAGALQATTSSGVGNSFADGTSATDTHTATPSDLTGIDFSIGRSGEFAGNYGDFSADFGGLYHEYLSVDYLGTQHENVDNMTTHITVADTTDIKKIIGVAIASVKKIIGVTNANAKKVAGVAN